MEVVLMTRNYLYQPSFKI